MSDIKNTTRTETGVEIYETEIEYALDCYLSEHPDIESLNNEPQSRWNSALRYIYKRVFKNTDKLKLKPYEIKTGKGTISNNNSYDIDKVNTVLEKYIDLCFEYGKEVSIVGFSYLTGIDQETIYAWNRDSINNKGSEIYKKLYATREETLSDKLYSSKNNPVGVLGILNHFYGWSIQYPKEQKDTQPKSIEQLKTEYIEQAAETTEPPKIAENRDEPPQHNI